MVLQAIGVSSDGDHMRVMENPVKDCISYHSIIKNAVPVAEIDIGCQDCTLFLITHINQLKEKIGILLVDRKIADLVDDQQFIAVQMLQPCLKPVLKFCFFSCCRSS